MMFAGSNGTIISGFLREDPKILGPRAKEYENIKGEPFPNLVAPQPNGTEEWLKRWIDGCRNKTKNPASFEYAKEVNETFNLGAISLMRQGKKLTYNPQTRTVDNDPEAHRLLTRNIRKGWEM